MQQLHFQYAPDDYRSWIRFQMRRGGQQKKKMFAFILYAILLVILIYQRLNPKEGVTQTPQDLLVTLGIALVIGLVLFFGMSEKHQEKLIFRRSGVEKAAREGKLPKITMTVRDDCIRAEQAGMEGAQLISYRDIKEIIDFENLFILNAGKQCELLPKSAFADDEEREAFRTFIQAKIDDVKANPDKYPTVTELRNAENRANAAAKAAEEGIPVTAEGIPVAEDDGSIDVDESAVTRVDTSHMGRLGKIAHMVAADAGEDRTVREPEVPSEPEAENQEPEAESPVPEPENTDREPEAENPEPEAEQPPDSTEEAGHAED